MSENYRALHSTTLAENPEYRKAEWAEPGPVTTESPALDVMTDLSRITAVTAHPGMQIDAALQRMIHRGIRLLLVVDADDQIVGLITARDLMGEKPVHIATFERMSHDEIIVDQVMTPRSKMEVLAFDEVTEAKVGDVIKTLQSQGRQHALVVESEDEGKQIVRGIFSITQIGRQMGVEIEPSGIKQSFGDLEAALNH